MWIHFKKRLCEQMSSSSSFLNIEYLLFHSVILSFFGVLFNILPYHIWNK